VKSAGDLPAEAELLLNDPFATFGFEPLSRRGFALRLQARQNNAALAQGPPPQKLLDQMVYLSNFSKETVLVDLSMLGDARGFLAAALLDASHHLGVQCPGGVGEDCGVGGLGFSAAPWSGAGGEKPWVIVSGLTLRNANWSAENGLSLAAAGSSSKAPALALFPAALKSLPGALWSVAPSAPQGGQSYLAPLFDRQMALVLAVHLPSQDGQAQCLAHHVSIHC